MFALWNGAQWTEICFLSVNEIGHNTQKLFPIRKRPRNKSWKCLKMPLMRRPIIDKFTSCHTYKYSSRSSYYNLAPYSTRFFIISLSKYKDSRYACNARSAKSGRTERDFTGRSKQVINSRLKFTSTSDFNQLACFLSPIRYKIEEEYFTANDVRALVFCNDLQTK